MESLMLCFRGRPVRELVLGEHALEVGGDPECDVHVDDPDVAARQYLVRWRRGAVVVQDVSGPGHSERALPFGQPLRVGRDHTLLRVPSTPRRERAVGAGGRTEPLEVEEEASSAYSLVVGHGDAARRMPVRSRPITIGSGCEADLVLSDPTVSANHCRLEPADSSGVTLRDLGSRNGTWVDGVRVAIARVDASNLIRIGRSQLMLVPRGCRPTARGDGLIAASVAMQALLGEVRRYAKLSWPVLVQGESGAGKEGVARALHEQGPRRRRPFVAINAGGLPRELVESELFGHERGAFTGAVGVHRGVFEQADGGTLFLDEVGELPLALQARLLRVLETWLVRRVGGESSVRVDVRLVCATHRDLPSMVRDGTFRQDLYYRLARLVLTVPPLRGRPQDIVALAAHFLDGMASDVGARRLTEAARARLVAHDWPGNARELRNVLGVAAASAGARDLEADDISRALQRVSEAGSPSAAGPEAIADVLERYDGNVAAAARALGIPRTTLRDRIRGLARAGTAGGPRGWPERVRSKA